MSSLLSNYSRQKHFSGDISITIKTLEDELYSNKHISNYVLYVFWLQRVHAVHVAPCRCNPVCGACLFMLHPVVWCVRDRDAPGLDTVVPLETTAAYNMMDVITGVSSAKVVR